MNIGVLVSGGGSNLQAIIDATLSGIINNAIIKTVVSSKDGVFALQRAKENGINAVVISPKNFESTTEFDLALISHMKSFDIDLVVMAGFMSILGHVFISEYKNAIMNVHPSLIPAFCGKGFYGLNVHKKVLDYGVKVTGATVHFVNEIPDGGPIILQKSVDILGGDTPEILQKRVMEQAEWLILPKAIALFCDFKLNIIENIVYIKEV